MAGALETHAIWRAVRPADIEAQLTELWKDAARDGPISRALMSNLIVVRPHTPGTPTGHDDVDPELVEVARRHPSRTIVLNYSPRSDGAGAPAAARVGVVTFAATERYGIEVIAVDAACADRSIPSIVRRLIRGSVPTSLWWAQDLSVSAPPPGLVAAGRQLIYDSAMWRHVGAGARAVSEMLPTGFAPDLADLNWRRLAALRSAIAHAFGMEPSLRTLPANAVRIRHRPGDAAAASLLAGWFGCRLKWGKARPHIEEARLDSDVVQVAIESGGTSIATAMSPERIKVKCSSAPVFRMPVPRESTADAVVAELRSLRHDRCLPDAVRTLAAMAE
jgi:glucose-6-phosphate dehydrogenase assembly protein OpcA